ncbi:MAG: hypothetical protein WD271_00790 [Acidimicrobiia bacterium]
MDWLVHLDDDAYVRWVQVAQPTEAVELAMVVWLVRLEEAGPPSITRDSSRGYAVADGPHDEEIEFFVIPRPLMVVQRPPWGLIAILSIS